MDFLKLSGDRSIGVYCKTCKKPVDEICKLPLPFFNGLELLVICHGESEKIILSPEELMHSEFPIIKEAFEPIEKEDVEECRFQPGKRKIK